MDERFRAPKGTTDVVFPSSEQLERVVAVTLDVLKNHGYRYIMTPVLESTELFSRTIGEESDIVTKEMYTFEDRGGESLTLRPEGTAPVVRAFFERGLSGEGLPQKLFYYGPMFRRERPQAGRFRQFLQVGAEAIGTDDPFVDAEVISLSELAFRKLGLERYRLLVNSVGCRECRPAYIEALKGFLEGLKSGLCEQCARRASVNPLRVFDCKEERCRELLAPAPKILDFLCGTCEAHFTGVLGYLQLLGVSHEVNGRLVRGLDYYTNTTFEFQFDRLGAQNTVCGGGRYDYLAEELGGPHTPGVGFSMGVERLLLSIEAEGLEPFEPSRLDVFVIGVGGVDRGRVLELLAEVRRAGMSADTDFMGRSLKAQMKQADRLGARLALIVGADELERGEVVLRDLDRSEQRAVPLDGVVGRLEESLEVGG